MPTTERLYPQMVKEVLQLVGNYIAKITERREEQILTDLKNVKELEEIKEKEIEIEEELGGKVIDAARYDKGMQKIVTKFAELLQPGAFPEPDDYVDSGPNSK